MDIISISMVSFQKFYVILSIQFKVMRKKKVLTADGLEYIRKYSREWNQSHKEECKQYKINTYNRKGQKAREAREAAGKE